MDEAINLLRSDKIQCRYVPVRQRPFPQPASLAHTYPRFCGNGQSFQFVLVPSEDAHLHCDSSNIWRSQNGLPYPALPDLVQSFVDTDDEVALCDVIDGANLTEEWGNTHLNLDGTNDLAWAKRMNERAYSSWEGDPAAMLSLFPTATVNRREMWESKVRGKTSRMGWTQPEQLFETRFRLKNSDDPWKKRSQAS